jgi:Flp pilus assembly protein TadG
MALVEFAILFPVLLVMYTGIFTLTDAISCNRKVTTTARAVTDLATRYSSLSEAEATTIVNASAQVLYPYSSSNSKIVLSEIRVVNATQATVVWSKANTGTAHTAGSTISIPANTAATDTYLILGEVRYTYTPSIWFGSTAPFNLADSILMLPRISTQVPLS